MDPFTLMQGASLAIGLGMQLFGTAKGASDASKAAGVSADIAKQEQGIEAQRQQQMRLVAQRQQIENVRKAQQARSMNMAASTNQGSQFGSGVKGGQAQVTGQQAYNSANISQNLQIGENIFGYNSSISQDKIQMASLQGSEATSQGISSAGGAIAKVGPGLTSLIPGSKTGGNPWTPGGQGDAYAYG